MRTPARDLARQAVAEYLRGLLRLALDREASVDGPWTVPIPEAPSISLVPGLVAAVAEHRVSPCLAPVLDDVGLPREMADAIRAQHRAAVRASLRVQSATAFISSEAESAGIRCLAYKGVALAERTTGEPSARGGGDVDLVFSPRDLPAVHAFLTSLGATLMPGWTPEPGSPLWPWAVRVRPEAPYAWRGVDIDVHWRLDRLPQAMSTDFDSLWAGRDRARIGGAVVPTLGPVDALLATCVHGTKEHWRQWRWAVDVVRQVRLLPQEAWGDLRARAQAAGAEQGLAIGLAVVERLTNASTPLAPGPWARARACEAWAESVSGATPFGRITAARQFERLAWTVRTRPNDASLLSLAAQLAWSSQDMAEVPLPPALLPAYPLLRPFLWRRRLSRADDRLTPSRHG